MGIKETIVPKSDQLNADDLIAGPRTILITAVKVGEYNPDAKGQQPVDISFEGDKGRPWKPCKSMRRVLVNLWGDDAQRYVGRSVTLFRDENVTFGKDAVGGIRISHMSHLEQEMSLSLTMTRGSRKPFKVSPLQEVSNAPDDETVKLFDSLVLKVPADIASSARDFVKKNPTQSRYEKAIDRLKSVSSEPQKEGASNV